MLKKGQILEATFHEYTVISGGREGGAAQVFKVENEEGEIFSIKLLKTENCTTEKLKRYKNEISFSQRTYHPNIVTLDDHGFIKIEGIKCPFYVMPFYDQTLRHLMNSGLEGEKALKYFFQILNGLEYAHSKQTWHRDLKPENILYDSNKDRVIIADFGIAHIAHDLAATNVETKATSRFANFQYHSPEQKIKGNNANINHLTDIYSLGLILNEMFTKKILQGTEFLTIGEVDGSYSFLDDVVSQMVKQIPEQRVNSIVEIKKIIYPNYKNETGDLVPSIEEMLDSKELKLKLKINKLKTFLAEPSKIVSFHDFIGQETNDLIDKLISKEFDLHSREQTIESRIKQFDIYTNDLCSLYAEGVFWTNESNFKIWKSSLEKIAHCKPHGEGLITFIAMRLYPALKLFYVAGISCIANDNYEVLKLLFKNVDIPKIRETNYGAIDLYPENVVNQRDGRTITGLTNRHTPMSDYLFEALRPFFKNTISADSKFEEYFNLFEYLAALMYSSQNADYKKAEYVFCPTGRFSWKDKGFDSYLPKKLNRILQKDLKEWPPFKANMFEISFEDFLKMKAASDKYIVKAYN